MVRVERGFSLKGNGDRYNKAYIRELCSELNGEEKERVKAQLRAGTYLGFGNKELAKYALKVLEEEDENNLE